MHRIGYLLTDGFQVLSLATQTVFEFANLAVGKPVYSIEHFSPAGGLVRSSLGLTMETRPLQAPRLADTWMVVGVNDPLESEPTPKFSTSCARPAARRAVRSVSAPALSSSPKQDCSPGGERRPIGPMPRPCRNVIRKSWSRKTVSTSSMALFGHRQA